MRWNGRLSVTTAIMKLALLISYTNREHIKTCYQEYLCAHEKDNIQDLMEKGDFPDIPLVLITHSSKLAIEESMKFGNNSHEFASRIEDMWQSIMKEYYCIEKTCLDNLNGR